MASLQVEGTEFIYDGKPLRIISGAMHYFRIVPEYWQDRLQKLKACGFNTVETYVPWNYHEPKKDSSSSKVWQTSCTSLRPQAASGLFVIVRPSPYICAEWEFGGCRHGCLRNRICDLRCYNDKPFLSRCGRLLRCFDA